MAARKRWIQQPSGLFTIDRSNSLSRNVTHLYTPTQRVNVASAGIVQTAGTTYNSVYRNGVLWDRSGGSAATGNYLPQSGTQVNLQLPWTIAALMAVDPNVSGVDGLGNGIVCTTSSGGVETGSFDRGLGFGFSSPNLTLIGSLFDGGAKTVTHQTGIPFSSSITFFTAVVSASNGFLRCFLNGIPCTTETAIANNGFGGYGANVFLSWGNLNNNQNYMVGLLLRADGFGWSVKEARDFHQNPWQVFAPPRGRRSVKAQAGGGTNVSATTAVETWNGRTATINVATNVAATTGVETWGGRTATITTGNGVSATTGVETWNGSQANINAAINITAITGVETWNGRTGTIGASINLLTTPGTETWNGRTATVNVSGPTTITTSLSSEIWGGYAATVTPGGGAGVRRNRVFGSKKHVTYRPS